MELGKIQKLKVVKMTDNGARLGDETQDVLLPRKEVPEGIAVGDELEVFICRDSEERPIATMNRPVAQLGEIAVMKVNDVTKYGAFLDWGLGKDLFLPYKEQTAKVHEGDEVLVRLYIDKSKRLCASMRGLYELLSMDSSYEAGETVHGRVYEFSNNFGAFVAVDDKYSALIPRHEDHSHLRIGEVIEAKIVEVKPDGKLTLTMRDKAYIQMEEDAKQVLQLLDQYAGVLPFTDKASPEVIMRETKMSKNAFKRAVGHLYKERKIEIKEHCIRKK